MSLPIHLQPSEFIKDASQRFDDTYPLNILDIGSHVGRNSVFLAKLGHNVLGITDLQEDVDEARSIAERHQVAGNCHFERGDMREMNVEGPFDIVLMTEVLHLVTPRQAEDVITHAKDLTKQGGLHLVSGYLVDPHKANVKNRERMFWPGQLRAKYDKPGWDILGYVEDAHKARYFGNQQFVDSLARVVAQKSW